MNPFLILAATLLYIGVLFGIAFYGDKRAENPRAQTSPFVFTLALAVYCSSWTFYGAVGTAAQSGWDYLPIYLGPAIVFLFAPKILARIGDIVQRERLTSLSDFLSARYGRSRSLAAIATLAAAIGALPYISLQMRSISHSFEALAGAGAGGMAAAQPSSATVLITAIALAAFAILFGARHSDTTRHNAGLVLALAFEAIVKLLALGMVCILSYRLLGGSGDWQSLYAQSPFSGSGVTQRFVTITLLAMLAIVCLPRQFHVLAIERNNREDVFTARWLFPAYLAVTSLVVVPITLAGLRDLPDNMVADLYVLALPLQSGNQGLALAAFLGGFSAATGMVIVSSIALSTMITNDLIVPLLMRSGRMARVIGQGGRGLLMIRRSTIIGLLALAYGYFLLSENLASLLSQIGLLSFAAAAQFAPLLAGALFWRRAHRRGAIWGLTTGMSLWAYTLLLPALIGADHAIFGGLPAWLNPHRIFGLGLEDSLTHGVLVSLLGNVIAFVWGSLRSREELRDSIQAAAYTGEGLRRPLPFGDNRHMNAAASPEDLRTLAARFLSTHAVDSAFEDLNNATGVAISGQHPADWRLIQKTEKLLAGAIGASSARVLMTSVLGQDDVAFDDVLTILDQQTQADLFDRHMLQSMLENVSQGISVADGDQRLVAWNEAYINLFDYPPHLVRVGTPVAELIEHNIRRGWLKIEDSASEVTRRVAQMKAGRSYRHERRMPNDRWLRIIGNPMPGGGYVSTFTDITEDKEREQALIDINETLEDRVRDRTAELEAVTHDMQEAKVEAEQANRSKTRFLSAASHDLLQPLNAARLFLGAAKDKAGGETELLQQVDRSIQSADQLLRGLLDISRLDQGKIEPRMEAVDLGALLEELVAEARPMAEAAGLQLRLVPTSLYGVADKEFLRSILRNFISNARRYTKRGKVLVGVRRTTQGARIEVWDTGPGLEDAERSRIFDEFERFHETDNQGVRGAGIGLAVARRMASIMDMDLRVRSWPGQGSVFSVLVERTHRNADEAAQNQPRAREVAPSEAANHDKPFRVVCVDDETEIQSAMQQLLQGWGLESACAGNVADAAQLLQQAVPDLLILDWQLAGDETALDVLALLPSLPELPAVAIITANRSDEVFAHARQWGAPVFHKPVDPDELHAFVNDLR